MQLTSNEDLHYFKKEAIRRVKEWPFFYDSNEPDEQYVSLFFSCLPSFLHKSSCVQGSLYSPFLHDAVYLYALALNRTYRQGGTIQDGRWIMNSTKNTQFSGMTLHSPSETSGYVYFSGYSGHVVIDDVAGREPSFVIRAFTKEMKLIPVAVAHMYKADGQVVCSCSPSYRRISAYCLVSDYRFAGLGEAALGISRRHHPERRTGMRVHGRKVPSRGEKL